MPIKSASQVRLLFALAVIVTVFPDIAQMAQTTVSGRSDAWSKLGKHRYPVEKIAMDVNVQVIPAVIVQLPAKLLAAV